MTRTQDPWIGSTISQPLHQAASTHTHTQTSTHTHTHKLAHTHTHTYLFNFWMVRFRCMMYNSIISGCHGSSSAGTHASNYHQQLKQSCLPDLKLCAHRSTNLNSKDQKKLTPIKLNSCTTVVYDLPLHRHIYHPSPITHISIVVTKTLSSVSKHWRVLHNRRSSEH